MSCRNRSCCSSSSARSVGPGWLQASVSASVHTASGGVHALQEFRVLGFLEVLQVGQIGYELRLVKVLLGAEIIEIDGIRKTLHELGAC